MYVRAEEAVLARAHARSRVGRPRKCSVRQDEPEAALRELSGLSYRSWCAPKLALVCEVQSEGVAAVISCVRLLCVH